jgi:MFS family permease
VREFLGELPHPFKHANFRWVFFSRLSISMGMFFIQEFIVFYMKDAFGGVYTLPFVGQVADSPEAAAAIFLPILFLGGIATSLIAGILSDTYGRIPIAYAAGLILGVACMIFSFSHSFALSALVGVFFGLGYGAYESLSWALAADTLPSPYNHGKDMGLWHIAVVLPQAVATPLGGFLLDQLQVAGTARDIPQMGYIVDFSIAVICFILGSIFLRQIKGLS